MSLASAFALGSGSPKPFLVSLLVLLVTWYSFFSRLHVSSYARSIHLYILFNQSINAKSTNKAKEVIKNFSHKKKMIKILLPNFVVLKLCYIHLFTIAENRNNLVAIYYPTKY